MLMDYQKLYCFLFNAITNALEQIDLGRPETARIILMNAQQKSEEVYIISDEVSEKLP